MREVYFITLRVSIFDTKNKKRNVDQVTVYDRKERDVSVAVAPKTAQELYDEGFRVRLLPVGGESSSYYELIHPDGKTSELQDTWDPLGLWQQTLGVINGSHDVPFSCDDYNKGVSIVYGLEKLTKAG
jgi:hypothetical protein